MDSPAAGLLSKSLEPWRCLRVIANPAMSLQERDELWLESIGPLFLGYSTPEYQRPIWQGAPAAVRVDEYILDASRLGFKLSRR